MSRLFIKYLPTSAFPSGGRGTVGVSPMVDEVFQTQSYPKAPRKCDLVQRVKSRESGAKPRGAVCRKKIRTVEDACPYGFVRTTRKAAWCGAEGA